MKLTHLHKTVTTTRAILSRNVQTDVHVDVKTSRNANIFWTRDKIKFEWIKYK